MAGGLLAFFTVAMRTILSIIFLVAKLFQEHGHETSYMFHGSAGGCCHPAVNFQHSSDPGGDVFPAVRQVLGMMEAVADPVAQQTAAYVANNGVQALIVTGTFNLHLLINWNKYAEEGSDETEMNIIATRIHETFLFTKSCSF